MIERVMKFGVFDHVDFNGQAVGDEYAGRLRLVALYEELGFHCYHLAEHHATELGMAPSPSVFLAAVAARTSSIRLGSLVYLLPSLYAWLWLPQASAGAGSPRSTPGSALLPTISPRCSKRRSG